MKPIFKPATKAQPWRACGWPHRVADWTGITAVANREFRSGFYRIPEGATVTICRTTNSKKVPIETIPCEKCGVSAFMTAIHWRSFTVIAWPDRDHDGQK